MPSIAGSDGSLDRKETSLHLGSMQYNEMKKVHQAGPVPPPERVTLGQSAWREDAAFLMLGDRQKVEGGGGFSMTEKLARALATTLAGQVERSMPVSGTWVILVMLPDGRLSAIKEHAGWRKKVMRGKIGNL